MSPVLKKIIIGLFLLSVFVAPDARAFSISPTQFSLTVEPGKEAVLPLTVHNNQDSPTTFRFYVAANRPDSNGRPIFSGVVDEASSWVKIEKNSVNFAPQEKKTVYFNVTVPESARVSTHYLALMVESLNNKNSQVGISARAAALVTLVVAGEISEVVSIERWEAPTVVLKPQLPLNLLLKNYTAIALPVAGEISVYDFRGKQINSGAAVLGNSILSQSYRQLDFSIPFSPRYPGPYQAQIKVTYGYSKTVTNTIVTVWYLPWWSLVAGGGILSLVVIFSIKKKRG